MLETTTLYELVEPAEPAVSIYVALEPDRHDPRGPEARLRGLIAAAEAMMERDEVPEATRRAVLGPLRQTAPANPPAQHDPTLALFASAAGVRSVTVPARLPSGAFVGRHFHLKPVLPVLAMHRRFHVLALSKTRAKLLEVTPFGWKELALDHLPIAAQASIDLRRDAGTLLDAGREDAERQLLQMAHPQRLAAAVRAATGPEPAPLLLVADPQVAGNFAGHPAMADMVLRTLTLNPFALSPNELHARVVDEVRPALSAELDNVLEAVNARLGTAEPNVAIRFEEILAAAAEGRVDTLVVAEDETLWGDPAGGGTLSAHGTRAPRDEDLLNVAAVWTMRQRGRAFAVPLDRMPRRAPAAALLRY